MISYFLNAENIKNSDPYSLLSKLTEKIDLKKTDKYIALSDLSIYYAWKTFGFFL